MRMKRIKIMGIIKRIFGISIVDESVFPFGFNMKKKFSILLVGFNSKISFDK